jgi:hypothetical protein
MDPRLSDPNAVLREMPPAFIAQIGTGGCITKDTLLLFYVSARENHPTSYLGMQYESKSIGLESPSNQLNYIRETFGFNISELANILEITRPTVYSWLQGKHLKQDALSKISKLVNFAKQVTGLEIRQIHVFLHRPIFNGCSLYDKLKNNENIIESLKLIKEISEKEETARLEIKGSLKNKGSTDLKGHTKPFYRV